MRPALDVAAALLRHPQTAQVLLAQRPLHKVRGGLWECPGGKIESGESAVTALARELREELGIAAEIGELQFIFCHRYPDLLVRLHVHEVRQWQGPLQTLDVADLRWCDPLAALGMTDLTLAAADRLILQRLGLPAIYRVTPDCPESRNAGQQAWLNRVVPTLWRSPESRCLFRVPSQGSVQRRSLLRELMRQCPESRPQIVVSADIEVALELGLGLQLTASQLANPPAQWNSVQGMRAASCHNADELRMAAAIGCDWATLSPVQATLSHPQATALGWQHFQALAERARLPVYALGGVAPTMIEQARLHGAIGVAGISAFWKSPA